MSHGKITSNNTNAKMSIWTTASQKLIDLSIPNINASKILQVADPFKIRNGKYLTLIM